jgi:hypothetical protein
MFVARWIIDAKFGHKDEVLALCKKWQGEIGDRVGMTRTRRVATGSIGAEEGRLEMETQFDSLAALEKSWIDMSKMPAHHKFSKELEPHIVSGTNRWEILRLVEV